MKKLSVLLAIFLLLIPVSFAQAKNESSGQNNDTGQQTQQQTQQQTATVIPTSTQQGYQNQVNVQNQGESQQIQNQNQFRISLTGTGAQVRNQNQVNTQNQGQNSQLQVNTQEQENLGQGQGEGLQQRNQNAIQNMSNVAQKVQQLLQVRTTGGIGQQVRQIAQEQTTAQTQIQVQVNKLDSKGKLARLLTGTDYGAVKNLKQQIEQNQLRIEQLTQLQNQLSNQSDITMVQETIQALIAENTSLQERITSEEQTKSLFGWMFKFFAR